MEKIYCEIRLTLQKSGQAAGITYVNYFCFQRQNMCDMK